MRSFQHIAPPLRLFSGADCLKQLDRELERVNSRRALIFCGSSLARDGSLDLVRSATGGRCAGVFTGVRAHSPLPSVEAAAQQIRTDGADAIVAIGGGSAIVTARAASILVAEEGDLKSLSTSFDGSGKLNSPRLMAPKLPQLVIPTTPTTATVKVGSAVFDPAVGRRFALFDPKTRAKSIFIDPRLVRTVPQSLFSSASLDTFVLAIEGLMSQSGDPISDAMLMHAVRLLAENLSNPALDQDIAARGDVMAAAILCGQGTDYAGAEIATVLGHAMGARHDVENGTVKAIVLPHAIRFNAASCETGLRKIATAMGLRSAEGDVADRLIDQFGQIFAGLGIARKLRELNIPRDALAGVAALSMEDWFLRGNPRAVQSSSELQDILEAAW